MTRDQYVKAASVIQKIDAISTLLKDMDKGNSVTLRTNSMSIVIHKQLECVSYPERNCHAAIYTALETYLVSLKNELEDI